MTDQPVEEPEVANEEEEQMLDELREGDEDTDAASPSPGRSIGGGSARGGSPGGGAARR